MTIEKNGNGDLLSSWKEISAYLGCEERTCARWEKTLGLPVHRLEGARKSRVFAHKADLDRWREERNTPGPRQGSRAPHPKLAWFAAAALLLVGLAAGALLTNMRSLRASAPADFRLEGPDLVILDVAGRELWRYGTGIENLVPEARFRDHLQVKRKTDDGQRNLPWLAFADLDGDGGKETLFAPHTIDELGEGSVLCFDRKGRPRWRFETGRPVRFGDTLFSGDFSVAGFDVCDLDGDGRAEILVVAHQQHRFPSRLAVLDSGGALRGEFWNAGQINDVGGADLDGDGRKEVIAAGVNNEWRGGALALFDPSNVAGFSPQADPHFVSPEAKPGTMLRYVRTPRTDLGEAMGAGAEGFAYFEVLKDRHLLLVSSPTKLIFEFGPGLDALHVQRTHEFERLHREASATGLVRGVPDDSYLEDLRRRIQYWDGGGWRRAGS